MTKPSEWSFRETVVRAALVETGGHELVDDVQEGWVNCRRCGGGWHIRMRSEQADDSESGSRLWGNPLVFGQGCRQ
jgi:hypothetical protein